jgi:hypothetical protein
MVAVKRLIAAWLLVCALVADASGQTADTRLAANASSGPVAGCGPTGGAAGQPRVEQATTAARLPVLSGVLVSIGRTASAGLADTGHRAELAPASPSQPLPSDLVHVRVSRELLSQRVQRSVRRLVPVNDMILGTRLHGWATVIGTTEVTLMPSESQAVIEVTFAGTIQSQTVGFHHPAVLSSAGETWFHARSRLVLAADGISAVPSTAVARTRSTTTHLRTTLPGMRGRIAERVALRRVNELRPEGDRLAAESAARQVEQQLDAEVQAAAGQIRQTLLAAMRRLSAHESAAAMTVCFRTTLDGIDVVMRRGGDVALPLGTLPAADDHTLFSLRMHRLVVRQAISERQLVSNLRSLLTGWLSSDAGHAAGAVSYELKWSDDADWLLLNCRRLTHAEGSLLARE